ncbi:MAG: RtcB family protein [Firmicutes bacterium]|nr:RtcB family protein [Bacillota bacterium]
MISVKGKNNIAICYTHELESVSFEQVKSVCDREEFADCKLRIMPDVHAGMGCTIGTTMTITDKIVPGMVGVDIGCGMETVKLAEKDINYAALDKLIRRQIPSGSDVRKSHHPLNSGIDLTKLKIAGKVKLERARKSIGTLGGGNHFIEVGQAENGDLYLVVHSGSRHLGNEVARHYQDEACRALRGTSCPKDLAYVTGPLFDDYIHDMKLTQYFATLNRRAMTEVILEGMGLTELERFTTIHNYIDTDTMILRKGAVSAKAGEKLLIPINMRDGSLICVGKGNDDWNQSAPHGAGRLMSRTVAFKNLSLDQFKSEMSGVFTTSVSGKTLDEAPMAYKSMDDIVRHIGPTAEIIERIKPMYNFKASE